MTDGHDSNCSTDEEPSSDKEPMSISRACNTVSQAPNTPSSCMPYELLSTADLIHLMNAIVNAVADVIDLPRTYLRLGLSHFNWDKERIVEYYYENGCDNLLKLLHLPTPIVRNPNKASSSNKLTYCDICCLQKENECMHSAGCDHLFCCECWLEYLTTKLRCAGASERLMCPAHDCCRIIEDEMALEILNREKCSNSADNSTSLTSQFLKLLSQSFIHSNPTLKRCPNPACDMIAKRNFVPCSIFMETTRCSPMSLDDTCTETYLMELAQNRVTCACRETFCILCGESWHEPVMCFTLTMWLKKAQDDSETGNWIAANTKNCPKCQAIIEKAGGCNHMICKNNSCRYEFCWVCLGEWEPHGTSWYNCSRFDDSASKKARSEQELSRAALQRYLFYFNRYANHLHSLKLEHQLYQQVAKKAEELQTMGFSWIDTQFLRQAVDVLCTCRRTLMYTYVFGYYVKESNQVHIFEDNQHDLEMATEILSEYLERKVTVDGYYDMKQQVQDKRRYCEARRVALLRHVDEGYAKSMWEHMVDTETRRV